MGVVGDVFVAATPGAATPPTAVPALVSLGWLLVVGGAASVALSLVLTLLRKRGNGQRYEPSFAGTVLGLKLHNLRRAWLLRNQGLRPWPVVFLGSPNVGCVARFSSPGFSSRGRGPPTL